MIFLPLAQIDIRYRWYNYFDDRALVFMSIKKLNISRLLICACCLLPWSKVGTSAIAQRSNLRSAIISQANPPAKTVAEKLVGQWQLKYLSPIPLTVIITPEGKLFILKGYPFPNPSAYEFSYKINSLFQPMQIDLVSSSSDETLRTIFEFNNRGQLRVELMGLKLGEPRPNTFTAGAIFLEKVSTVTALPRNTKIEKFNLLEPENPRAVYEGEQFIRYAISAQQSFYAENIKFATTLEEMGIGRRLDTENYRYQIFPESGATEGVIMTLQSKKRQFRSYTGAVFLVKVKDDADNAVTSVGFICQTNQPSTIPPPRPIVPINNDKASFRCPINSSLISITAMGIHYAP
ncbi:type IV pilin-like G/H family protein [Microcoleus sp. herbarium14]|uniref:type IV pilin-like G/H family protein n=1 Tax=Microcoleus sp. herbarium14 TaxID=3055439 RepID=UPI002FCFB900